MKETSKFVSGASIDVKLLHPQSVTLKKVVRIVKYSSRILGLVSEKWRTLGIEYLRWSKSGRFCVGYWKAIMWQWSRSWVSNIHVARIYHDSPSARLVCAVRMMLEFETKTVPSEPSLNFFYCGKTGHISRECRKRDAAKDIQDDMNKRRYFKCGEVGHLPKNCFKNNDKDGSSNESSVEMTIHSYSIQELQCYVYCSTALSILPV